MKNSYTIYGYLRLAISYILTKIFYSNSRIIRFPFDVRGKKYRNFGERLTIGFNCRFEAFGKDEEKLILFGDRVQINDYVHISAMSGIEIGDDVLIASHVYISDNSHGYYNENGDSPKIPPSQRKYLISKVKIGNNVWLGEGVIVLPGVEIGDGCIIGAHSVVNKTLPKGVIAVGSPAKIIKEYDFKQQKWIKK